MMTIRERAQRRDKIIKKETKEWSNLIKHISAHSNEWKLAVE